MPTITFGGAHIRKVELRRNKEGGLFVHFDMTSDLSMALAETLNCVDARDAASIKVAELTREPMGIESLKLKANGLPSTLEIVATQISDFRVVHIQRDPDTKPETELRFHVSAPGGTLPLVFKYWEVVGEGLGQLRVAVLEQGDFASESEDEPAATQQTIDGREEKPPRRLPRKKKESSAEASATVG
jgi:hypothetical protein